MLSKKIEQTINNPFLRKGCFISIILIVSYIVYQLNHLYPIYIDDWDYSFIYYTDTPLSNILDIIPSMATHYIKWGGRIVDHTILQTMLLMGDPWNDILNTITFILYILLIYRISNKQNKNQTTLLLTILLLTWFFQADLGETILWLTGSANYLWGTTILLLFFCPYYTYFCRSQEQEPPRQDKQTSLTYNILFLIAGIIAGWTNENMVVAIFSMITIILYSIWRKQKYINKWMIYGCIGMSLGAIIMFMAPGNYKRYKVELGIRGYEGKTTINYYIENVQTLLEGTGKYLAILIILYLILATILWFIHTPDNKKNILIRSGIFFVGTTISIGAMLASPVFPPRAWFGIITLCIISLTILYANINYPKLYITSTIKWIVIIVGIVLFTDTYTAGKNELIRIRKIVDTREKEINKQKKEGKDEIVLYDTKFKKRDDLIIPKMYDFYDNPEHWMFKAYAHYHQVKTVRIIETK